MYVSNICSPFLVRAAEFCITILSWVRLIRKILTELYAVLKLQDLVMEIPTEEFRLRWEGKSTISNDIEYFFYL